MVGFFVILGLIILSSAGIIEGQKKFGSGYYYLMSQFTHGVLPGIILFFLCLKIPYKYWKKFALPLLLFSVALLVAVFLPHIGLGLKGANRWIQVMGISFQPSEFLKISLILYLAAWFSNRESAAHSIETIIPLMLVLGFIGLLLVLQPDFGTLGIVIIIAMGVYFFAGAKLLHLCAIIAFFLLALVVLSFISPYRFDRIKAFVDPAADRQGVSYHINQALLGIGSGGFMGLGFGKSLQKQNYLPEPVGDSIFAVIVEELGFVGAAVLIGLFAALTLTLIAIARSTSDPFGQLITLGVGVWIFGQALINIAAISGIIPLTGLPLPFISFGSSALVALLASLGIVANIAS